MGLITTKEEARMVIATEPIYTDFEHCGYKCIIKRVEHTGCLCGYVGIPKGHTLFGKDINDKIYTNREFVYNNNPMDMLFEVVDSKKEENTHRLGGLMEVHGGVTYSENLFPGSPTDYKELWWFGFDTGHAGDLCPNSPTMEQLISSLAEDNQMKEMLKKLKAISESLNIDRGEVYRDFKYVKENTIKLAENLKYYE